MSKIPVWIDTDTGVDDAVALLTAVYLERKGLLEIRGISAVCGNAELDKTFENARNVMYLAGREDIPVFPGAEKPLLVELSTAPYVHGEDGLGGAKIPPSPAARENMPAWDALYLCARECAGELELILMGPETNAAIALRKHPDLPKYLKRILIPTGLRWFLKAGFRSSCAAWTSRCTRSFCRKKCRKSKAMRAGAADCSGKARSLRKNCTGSLAWKDSLSMTPAPYCMRYIPRSSRESLPGSSWRRAAA